MIKYTLNGEVLNNSNNKKPNIIVILADDMGFSDIGSYGSEIKTPNIDKLASNGLSFSQMYNNARCCPSRASLLTGLSPHQAGIGHMTGGLTVPGYEGFLSNNSVTIAQILKSSGYETIMSGKWHVGDNPQDEGGPDLPPPMKRGFDNLYGFGPGCRSYFYSPTMWENDKEVEQENTDFYLTNEITDNAIKMIQKTSNSDKPFFCYLAYTAPHWPLQAPQSDIEENLGQYMKGWDYTRTARHEQLKKLKILDSKWEITPRDSAVPEWKNSKHQNWEDLRMSVYAAQIKIMDQGIGKLLDTLENLKINDNTIIMFLSDNGGCAEFLIEDPDPLNKYKLIDMGAKMTFDGKPVKVGNDPSINPGPDDTYSSYDVGWANVSNTPFRMYKRWLHEGGISTPFIIHWPSKIKTPKIIHEPFHITDITATCIDVAEAKYPSEFNGNTISPLEGETLLPLINDIKKKRDKSICLEHEGNKAIREGEWKLVSEFDKPWELYNINDDRTELNDLSQKNPEIVKSMNSKFDDWAKRCNVLPWKDVISLNTKKGAEMITTNGTFPMHSEHGHSIPIESTLPINFPKKMD